MTHQTQPEINYRVPITQLKASTNKIYAGIHWSVRKQLKDSVLSYAAGFCRPIQKVRSYPVEIRYRFIFASRALDTLNTAYLAKMFEDALCSLGVLEDDDPKHVARAVLEVVEATAAPGTPVARKQSAQKSAKTEDWLEITIKKFT